MGQSASTKKEYTKKIIKIFKSNSTGQFNIMHDLGHEIFMIHDNNREVHEAHRHVTVEVLLEVWENINVNDLQLHNLSYIPGWIIKIMNNFHGNVKFKYCSDSRQFLKSIRKLNILECYIEQNAPSSEDIEILIELVLCNNIKKIKLYVFGDHKKFYNDIYYYSELDALKMTIHPSLNIQHLCIERNEE